MTSNDPAPVSGPRNWVNTIRAKLDPIFTPARREALSRVLAALIIGLQGVGVLTMEKAALWGQLGVAAVGLIYALLWAGTPLRVLLYSFILSTGSVVMAYGIIDSAAWAIIAASIAQAFGIVTAAAKAQPPGDNGRHAVADG